MSIAVMTLVWRTDLKDSDKLVALALADWADDGGRCYPAMDDLVFKCSKPRRTIQEALGRLERGGLLRRVHRAGHGVEYFLQVDALKAAARELPSVERRKRGSGTRPLRVQGAAAAKGCGHRTGSAADAGEARRGAAAAPPDAEGVRNPTRGGAMAAPNTSDTPSRSDERETGARARAAPEGGGEQPRWPRYDDFPAFWAAYPHKVGVERARKAWGALVTAGVLPTLGELLAAVEAYRRGKPAGREWCNPATWLAEGRWLDGRSIEAGGVKLATGEVELVGGPTEVSAGLLASAAEAMGRPWAVTWLHGAVERDGRLTPRTLTGFDRMRGEARFMDVLAALGVELVKPPPRPSG